MAENSKIEWTDHTFNPWMGCTKVSDGCKYCYAEAMMDKRMGRVKWGPAGQRSRTSPANWKKPLKWNREAEEKGIRYRVFCASLADVFEDKPNQPVIYEWRQELFDLIRKTPNLDWLLLTKRPENVERMIACALYNTGLSFPEDFPNVWIGTSVEDQATADERIPELLKIPASVRFLSMEPLLGPVDLTNVTPPDCGGDYQVDALNGIESYPGSIRRGIVKQIDWVIVGGESGQGARPFDLTWAYSIKNQCLNTGVPVFIKQLGANPTSVQRGYTIKDKKGGNWNEWPEDLRIRGFPAIGD